MPIPSPGLELTSHSRDSVLSLHSSRHLPERIGSNFPRSVWLAYCVTLVPTTLRSPIRLERMSRASSAVVTHSRARSDVNLGPSSEIRTHDLLFPKQARYRAAPYSEWGEGGNRTLAPCFTDREATTTSPTPLKIGRCSRIRTDDPRSPRPMR